MSRHSKWAKIKRQKAVTDVRRGQVFTKLSRAITVAAREGGGDQGTNVRLRIAIDRALAENMPKDNIQRAIDRGAGGDAETAMESIVLEGYGPSGAAILIEAVTDNRNRTVGEIRRLLGDAGGSLGSVGSTHWMFERRGRIMLQDIAEPDTVELAAIDAGALDIARDGTTLEILTPPDRTQAVADALSETGHPPQAVETVLLPQNPFPLAPEAFGHVATLVEQLEERDDVVDVVTNAIPHEEGHPSP